MDPEPGGVPEHIAVRGNTLSVLGGIHLGLPGTVTAYGAPMGAGGGGVCAHGAEGTFTWSVAGDTLTLSATNPGCASRQAIYTGTWTRVNNPPARELTFTQPQ